jgi:hypothetical protein
MPFLAKYGFSLVYNRPDWHGRFWEFHIKFSRKNGKKSENLRFEDSKFEIANLRISNLRFQIGGFQISEEMAGQRSPRPKVKGPKSKAEV